MLCLLVTANAIDLPAVYFQDLRREFAVLKKELMAALEPPVSFDAARHTLTIRTAARVSVAHSSAARDEQ